MIQLPSNFTKITLGLFSAFLGSTLAISCLTPEATFDESDSNDPVGKGGSSPVTVDPNHCENRTTDANETDTDCGGQDCEPCALGSDCELGRDCENSECSGNICRNATCMDEVTNGNETDQDCGGQGCPACATDQRCQKDGDCESRSCTSGICAEATCSDRIQNGNETDRDCGGANCSPCDSGKSCLVDDDCQPPPADDPARMSCLDQACTIACASGTGDCNQQASDGCEINLNTEVDNCGACGAICAPGNAVAGKCDGGACLIDIEAGGCEGAFLDCNGIPEDGCEVDTSTDDSRCGGCQVGDANGGAGVDCTSEWAHAAGHCESSTCVFDECHTSWGNCDGQLDDACETDLRDTNAHCGACDNSCTTDPHTASNGCTGGFCNPICNGSGELCDDSAENGCENIQSEADRGSYSANSFTCQGGGSAATCDIDLGGGSWTMAGSPTCQQNSHCNVDASDGGHLDAATRFDCQDGSKCIFNCSEGDCGAVRLQQNGTFGLFDCEGGDCGAITCQSGTTCVFRMSRATGKPSCASGANCLCVSGTAFNCDSICEDGEHAPCGNTGGGPIAHACSF